MGPRLIADKPATASSTERPAAVRPEMVRLRRRRFARHLRLSPITRKIMLVNGLAILIPIIGLLFSGAYRERLIDQELQALKEQGEIIAGALGEGAIGTLDDGSEVLNIVAARDLARRLSDASGARAQFFLANGQLAVDSRMLRGAGSAIIVEDLADPTSEDTINPVLQPVFNAMDSVGTWLDTHEYELYLDLRNPVVSSYPEAEAALSGRPVAKVRRDGREGLVLTVALPVQRFYRIFGSLMLTRDGERIDRAMNEVRLTLGLVFAGALVITLLISFYFAGTIARPLQRLAVGAERVRHTGGRDPAVIPDLKSRGDEIGDLSHVLREMTQALSQRILAIERFAADVSHEIKNPLTSLKSAIETVQRVRNPDQQQELLRIIKEDVERLDRLITDISDSSRLDGELERAELDNVDIAAMLETLVDMQRTARGDKVWDDDVTPENPPSAPPQSGPHYRMSRLDDGPFVVNGIADRLVQVFRNLMGNAESFSPQEGSVRLSIRRDGDWVVVSCEDDGPGMPPGKLNAVFDRFYSERPQHEKFGSHSGLGLSISKQIIDAHEGDIYAENITKADGTILGARFIVRLQASH